MNRQEQAENAMSMLMRFGISLLLPAWALLMVGLGLEYRSAWWLGCGLVVGAIGLLLLVGNPLAAPALDLRESWRPVRPTAPKPAAEEASADSAHH